MLSVYKKKRKSSIYRIFSKEEKTKLEKERKLDGFTVFLAKLLSSVKHF